MPAAEPRGWFRRALWIVVAITLLRIVLLRFNRTDLFVDESQYWLWGYELAFGYYSKPPLIAWVIRSVTWLADSNAPFWVRLPGPLFHAATALILAAMAARLLGARAAVWVAASYVTLPMVALGSLLISTDTIMAPFFAAALLCHLRLTETGAARFALLAGAAAGLAFLAKYAAIYFLLGVGLGALLLPAFRVGWRNAALLFAAFGAIVAPNVVWNLRHQLTTLSHTLDNVGWVREAAPLAGAHLAGGAEFLLAQFAVMGPVLFAALIWAALARLPGTGRLLVFSLPPLAVVTLQGVLSRAYANWAVSAYFSGIIAAVQALLARPRLLWLSLAVNGAICIALPVLTLMPEARFGRAEPLLSRYTGQVYLARQILSEAEVAGVPVVADRRDILAELFHTGGGVGVRFYALPPRARPKNYFEQRHALPRGLGQRVLLVSETAPMCDGRAVAPDITFDTAVGAYRDVVLHGYFVASDCLDAAR
jgi:4-amino-4-deoxy-L-arabinose transferase-like glycosyltransferase